MLIYKQKKAIAAKNKRNFAKDPNYDPEPEAQRSNMDASTFSPEHFIFSGYYNQPIFSVPHLANAHAYYDSDEEGNLLGNDGDSDGATGTSISTSTSKVFKKRSNASIITQFPSRKKQKLDAKKASTYNKSRSKNEESI